MTTRLRATIQARPQFHDIDPMNVVWHGNYPRFFELARVALLEQIDYGYEQMSASGYSWPVVEMTVKYAKPIKLLQLIEVSAQLVEWENRLKIAFEIRDKATGDRLSRGHAIQVAVSVATGEMLWRTPEAFQSRVRPYL